MPAEIVIIVAIARNGVIGRDNALPWRLKADLKFFRAATTGHTIVMGRKTWESLGRPLPQRHNVVISRNPAYHAEGATVVTSIDQALALAAQDDRAFVIGGAEIYRQALPRADRLLVTRVEAEVGGDTHFPPIDPETFVEVSASAHPADADNDHPYTFIEYRRRG
jgi:dihydrofolate reductase